MSEFINKPAPRTRSARPNDFRQDVTFAFGDISFLALLFIIGAATVSPISAQPLHFQTDLKSESVKTGSIDSELISDGDIDKDARSVGPPHVVSSGAHWANLNDTSRAQITGTVTDAETGEEIAGTTISNLGGGFGSVSDRQGNYTIDDVPAGNHVLSINLVGYCEEMRPVTLQKGETIQANFQLIPYPKSTPSGTISSNCRAPAKADLEDRRPLLLYLTPRKKTASETHYGTFEVVVESGRSKADSMSFSFYHPGTGTLTYTRVLAIPSSTSSQDTLRIVSKTGAYDLVAEIGEEGKSGYKRVTGNVGEEVESFETVLPSEPFLQAVSANPDTATVGEPVQFEAEVQQAQTVEWKFRGVGEPTEKSGASVTRTYLKPGRYLAVASAQNDLGKVREVVSVQVEPHSKKVIAEERSSRPADADTERPPRSNGRAPPQTSSSDQQPSDQKVTPGDEVMIDSKVPSTNMSHPDAIAVVIGVKDYQHDDVPSVDYALNDARTMKKYLVQTMGYRERNVIVAENASGSDLRRLFGTETKPKGKLYNYVQKGESPVFVYYSGHGAPDASSQKAYLLGSNTNPNYMSINGYPVEQLYENLAKIPAKSVTVTLDACFSGVSEAGQIVQNVSPAVLSVENPIIGMENGLAFTAGAADQVSSWYPEKRHGLFTYYFLKGLRGNADQDDNQTITAKEMEAYLKEKVPYWARRMHNREQVPQVVGQNLDRMLVEYERKVPAKSK